MSLQIGLLFLILSYAIAQTLKSKLRKYANLSFNTPLSGAEIAAKILEDNKISDVSITVDEEGYLTDHYDPLTKTVTLSKDVYYGRNIAATSIAAHECGHALQHADGYAFLRFRSAMVPSLQFASRYTSLLIILGMAISRTTYIPLAIGIGLYALTTLFTFITLPVEFDASRRALNWIEGQAFVSSKEHSMAKDALKWAALTYVIAALGSLTQLLHLIGIFNNRRD
jgi:Zn-dependent membrane protease YugP